MVAEQADILTCLANKAGQIMIPLQILRGALPLTEWRTATCTHQRFLSLIRLSDIILLGGLEMRSDLKKIGEQKSTYLVGQTERALYLLDVISTITDRGNNAEVRRKKDGTLTVYEVKKNIVTV